MKDGKNRMSIISMSSADDMYAYICDENNGDKRDFYIPTPGITHVGDLLRTKTTIYGGLVKFNNNNNTSTMHDDYDSDGFKREDIPPNTTMFVLSDRILFQGNFKKIYKEMYKKEFLKQKNALLFKNQFIYTERVMTFLLAGKKGEGEGKKFLLTFSEALEGLEGDFLCSSDKNLNLRDAIANVNGKETKSYKTFFEVISEGTAEVQYNIKALDNDYSMGTLADIFDFDGACCYDINR